MRKVVFVFGLLICANGLFAQALTDTSAQLKKWYSEASALIENYQFDQALEPLASCYHYGSNNKDYLLKIAYCHQQLGRYRDAKIYYNEVLKRDSSNIHALSAHASIATQEANYLKAQDYYQRLIKQDTSNSYFFKQAAYTAIRRNLLMDAIQYFMQAHRLNADDLEVIDQLGDIFLAMDDIESADQIVQKGLNLDQMNIKLLRNKARIHQKRKEHQQVIEHILKIMAQGDTSDHYQTMIGVAYMKVDSLDQGIFHLEKIVARKKADDRTFHYLGLAYFNKENFEKSKEYFELAIKAGTSTKMYAYHGDLALLLDKENAFRGAIQHYKKSLEYKRSPEYIFHLGHVSDRYYKDKKIALKLYNEYLATPSKKYRKFATQRIEQLKEHIHFQSK